VLGAALVYSESDRAAFVVLFRISSGGKAPPDGSGCLDGLHQGVLVVSTPRLERDFCCDDAIAAIHAEEVGERPVVPHASQRHVYLH
jgi:hypothetical protein